jgi:hypothetical protein
MPFASFPEVLEAATCATFPGLVISHSATIWLELCTRRNHNY